MMMMMMTMIGSVQGVESYKIVHGGHFLFTCSNRPTFAVSFSHNGQRHKDGRTDDIVMPIIIFYHTVLHYTIG